MPFVELSALAAREPAPGCQARFVHTENMTLAYWEIAAGSSVPEHAHPHEQVVNVIAGELELSLGGESQRLGPGTVAVVPPDVPHAGRAITDCQVIDCFHPVREDYR